MIKIIMSQLKIINFRDIGINSYNFFKPTRNVGNSYIAKTTYSKNIRCVIQLPKLRTPEGIITIDKKEYLTLEIDKYNWDIFEFLSNVDEYCIKYVSDKSNEWFDSEYSVQSIENSYKNTVKLTSTKKLPVIRLRIPPGERDNIYFFDERKNRISIDNVIKDTNIVVLIELEGLRFLRTQVIPVWNLLQCKIYKNEVTLRNLSKYLIMDDLLDDIDNDLIGPFEDELVLANKITNKTEKKLNKNRNFEHKLDTSELNTSELNTSELDSSELNTSELDSSELNSNEIIGEMEFDEIFSNSIEVL